MGHVRDLPERELAVDVEQGFQPRYEVVDSRKQTITDLRKAVKSRDEVILASDPDREGEAIAWHLAEVLRLRHPKRIEFHEITSDAVRRALSHPREIDMRLVNAQQARRVVDRLVGYRLSPFLWGEEQRFKARLARRLAELDVKLELKTEADAQAAIAELEGAEYRVVAIEQKRRSKNAPPPYITSTLQQDASSRLRYSPKKTMRLAQDLYEGIELGSEGATGLITYMRTDSTRISAEADAKVQSWIKSKLGERYLGKPRPEKARPAAQDAHEAIRPTDPNRRPDDIRQHLTPDQFRVYELIWRRFVASRMAAAQYAGTTVDIEAGSFGLRATGSVLTFDGFYRIWERDDEREEQLPELREGEILDFHGLVPEQHFTQPPPRYTEATLINELEKRGIGRPSTYATIVATIQDHSYVEQRERRLHPTQLGEAVNSIMVGHFQDIVDDRYTAAMEERLDDVEQGKVEWVPVVGDFYVPLERMLSAAAEAMPAETGEECPECHEGQLVLKASRYGPFKGCSRYPACRYRRAVLPNGEPDKPQLLDDTCPECGRQLQVRRGRYGEFVGCSGYPDCRYVRRDQQRSEPVATGEVCPECGQGQLVERQGRYGPFRSCSRYPDCKYRVATPREGRPRVESKPLDEPCPICGKPLVERQGRYGPFKSCSDYPRCKGPQRAGRAAKA